MLRIASSPSCQQQPHHRGVVIARRVMKRRQPMLQSDGQRTAASAPADPSSHQCKPLRKHPPAHSQGTALSWEVERAGRTVVVALMSQPAASMIAAQASCPFAAAACSGVLPICAAAQRGA